MESLELTVRLPKEDLEFAEQYARAQRITLTELIERYLKSLRRGFHGEIHPEVVKISGLIPSDVDARAEHRAHAGLPGRGRHS